MRIRTFLFFFLLINISPIMNLSFGQENQDRIKLYIEKAERNVKDKKYPEALVHLDSAAALNPDYSKIYMVKASIYEAQDFQRRAINEYNTAIRFDPGNAKAYYQRAVLQNEVGDHRDYSINDINRAISLEPENASYYLKKAYFLTSTTYPVPEFNLAIQTMSEAISLEPENAEFYNIRAKYKSESGQRLSSLSDFTMAIELDSIKPEYFYDRGLTFFMIEDFASSINDFNAAIQLDPLNETYLIGRGQSRFNLGDYETAILDFTLCIDTIYRKITQEPGKINLDHPLNKSLRRAYLYRGSALQQVESTFEACQDFEAAKNLGDRRAAQYIRTHCK